MLILIYIFHCSIFSFLFFSKPKFLERYVANIEEGWDLTKEKASARLDLLTNTKAAWEGYGVGLETIAVEFEKGEEEIKKVKKRFNLQGIFLVIHTLSSEILYKRNCTFMLDEMILQNKC